MINLFETGTAEVNPSEHLLGIGIIFGGDVSQVIVEIFFKKLGEFVLILIADIFDLDRPFGRQEFANGIRLAADDGFQQGRVFGGGHAGKGRRAAPGPGPWLLDLHAQKIDGAVAVLNPLLARAQVGVNAFEKILGKLAEVQVVHHFCEVRRELVVTLRTRLPFR